MLITGINREQVQLFTSLEDNILQDNPVGLIDYIVDNVIAENSKKFDYPKGHSIEGRPAYSFSTMLKIYIYGFIHRLRSSRRLEHQCKVNIELMWLINSLQPDHKTISDFRKDQGKIIAEFSKQFKLKLKSLGLLGNTYAVDGTKLKANANKDLLERSNLMKELSSLDTKLMEYLLYLDKSDTEEESTEMERQSYQKEISDLKHKIAKLNSYILEMDSRGQNYLSKTDKDCNLMKSRDGYIPSYNVQFAVDTENGFIGGDDLTSSANDLYELVNMVEVTKSECELTDIETLSDCGYANLDAIEELGSNSQVTCYCSLPEPQREPGFVYDKVKDIYLCPQNKEMKRFSKRKTDGGRNIIKYRCKECNGCPIREKCTKSKYGRTILRYMNQEFRDAYRARMNSVDAKKKMKKRGSTVECVFGSVKVTGEKIPLLTRGKNKVRNEIKLYVISYNVRHLSNLFTLKEIIALSASLNVNSTFILTYSLIISNISQKQDIISYKSAA
jgi:transposase